MGDTATLDRELDDVVENVRPLSRLKAETEWLRSAVTPGRPVGVDRAAGVIYGRVLAEKGPFKSPGRGEFDDLSLDLVVELAKQHPNGLKSRFTHPGLSADGLGKFLGRDHNIRRDGNVVRGDFHVDKTALTSAPTGKTPLGQYVVDLAESDPAALSSSLVLQAKKEYRLNEDGTRKKDADGNDLPPLWRPTKLHAIDVVDEGDAVHSGFLSADLPDAVVRDVWAALDEQFSGCDRKTIQARGAAFLDRYLDLKFGDDDMDMNAAPKPQPTPTPQPNPNPPQPQPKSQPTGELSAEIEAARAELQKQHEAIKAELAAREQALREQARADDAVACLKQAQALAEKGDVKPAALSDSAGFVPLGAFLHLLDNSAAVATETVSGKERPVTLRAAFLKLLPTLRPQASGERIPGGSAPAGLTPERKKQLLGYSDAGRAVLAGQK